MRLKYSFMSFSTPRASLAEMLDMAKRYGYDGIEPRIESGHLHGVEPDLPAQARSDIRKQVADSSIEMCCIATSCQYANPARTEIEIDLTHRCIDLAADLGVARIRVFGGRIPQDHTRSAAISLLADSFSQIGPYAAERNVKVCIETHDDWCDPHHVADVMSRVNNPAIRVNWDIMHPVRQGGMTIDAAYAILAPWISHVHFHDGLLRQDVTVLKPVGEGEIDHRRAVELLQANNYSGYLSGEWIDWQPPEIHLPRELATLRSYEGNTVTS